MEILILTKKDKGFDLNFTVKNDKGETIDLTDSTVKFQIADHNYTNKINGLCTITKADAGKCKYTFADNDLDLSPGNYWGCIEYTSGEKVISSSQFMVKIIAECG